MKQDVTYKEIYLVVGFNYSPEEPMVMYYPDGSGYPGCAAEIEIQEIIYDGVDVYEIYESMEALDDIEALVWNEMGSDCSH